MKIALHFQIIIKSVQLLTTIIQHKLSDPICATVQPSLCLTLSLCIDISSREDELWKVGLYEKFLFRNGSVPSDNVCTTVSTVPSTLINSHVISIIEKYKQKLGVNYHLYQVGSKVNLIYILIKSSTGGRTTPEYAVWTRIEQRSPLHLIIQFFNMDRPSWLITTASGSPFFPSLRHTGNLSTSQRKPWKFFPKLTIICTNPDWRSPMFQAGGKKALQKNVVNLGQGKKTHQKDSRWLANSPWSFRQHFQSQITARKYKHN